MNEDKLQRADLQKIISWIPVGSKILDVGCGDGMLLDALMRQKKCSGYGIEIEPSLLALCAKRGVDAVSLDIDKGLYLCEDYSFDVVVLSQTLQVAHNALWVLQESLRVGKQVIISFPNFGHWRHIASLMCGYMPKNRHIPFEWYNTPNIHWCTPKEFEQLCDKNKINIQQKSFFCQKKETYFLTSLLAQTALYRLSST
jgi:methionine biosynthesis protein MetW